MTYPVTDRRRRPTGLEAMPVRDALTARGVAALPVTGEDPYTPVPQEPSYDLTPLQLVFGEFRRHHATAKESNAWLKDFKKLLPPVVKDATLMKVGNLPVATFRHDGKLAIEKLRKEQPHIIAKYTRMVTKEEFDQEAFEREEPDLFLAYRGRSFRLVNSGPAAGLTLPV